LSIKVAKIQLNSLFLKALNLYLFITKIVQLYWSNNLHLHTHVHTYTFTHTYKLLTNTHARAHINSHTLTNIHTHTFTNIHSHTCSHIHTLTNIYTHTCSHIHTYTQTYTHTHMFTQARALTNIYTHTHKFTHTNPYPTYTHNGFSAADEKGYLRDCLNKTWDKWVF